MKLTQLFLFIFFFCLLGSCITETPIKILFQSYTPQNLSDGWDIVAPDDENIDGEALKDVYRYVHDDNDIWQIRGLLVFRNNRLVAESYIKDTNDRINPGAIWSCTKQITAILTGIAVDQNLIAINEPISKYLPQVSNSRYSNKGGITVENLLMMKSGINFNNSGFNGETSPLLRQEPSNSLNFILGLGMRSTSGTQFHYNDGDPHIVSAVLQEVVGTTMRNWAKVVLFDKIGINRLQWHTYKDGITFGAFGIFMTPREMAKIGQLILNDGMWGNEQIISNSWINEMTSSKVTANETHEDNITFGYYWWQDTFRNVLIMRGQGGQYVFINREKNLIVIITSEPNTQGGFQLTHNKGILIYDRINSIAY